MPDALRNFKAGETFNASRDVAVLPGGVPNVIDMNVEPLKNSEPMIDVGDLVRMFEESEDATYEARKEAERDRDYLDNKQLTSAELATLRARGQPPHIDNRIKTKVDYLVGVEKQQRVDPKAMPRTPKHEADADGATEALRYVAEEQDYDNKRSGIWRNMLVEGSGGIRVYVEPSKYSQRPDLMNSTAMTQQEFDIKLARVPWDRMFADPHSAEPDYSDAGYLGLVLWMDHSDALAMYRDNPDAEAILETTLSSAPSETYDDKPKHNHWADKKRKRVRICQIWIKKGDDWHFAEYTKGGILKAGPSPYKDDKGNADCELFFQSAYVDRDNNRYGLVREMISLQDAINKRGSKSLHLINVHQTIYEEGAIDDIEKFRKEKARPDGTMKVAPGALRNGAIITETRTDLADAHFKLMQDAKNSIDLKGPNATEMGDKTGGSNAASGKAIIASQQGGMTQIGDLMDSLRHLDKRVYRAIWNRIRQYWTAEKWIRVTDDEENVKWLGMNVDPMQVQMLSQQNPEAAEKIKGVVASVAELDCDIIIDIAPDGLTPQLEQFQSFVELKKYDTNGELPFRAIVEAMPNLRNKAKILARMDKTQEAQQQNPEAQQMKQLQFRGAMAEVAETESKAALNMAKAQEAGMPDPQQPQQPEQQEPFAAEKVMAEIESLLARAAQSRAAAHKTEVEADLAPRQAMHQAHMDQQNFHQMAKDKQADRQVKSRQPARV